MTIVLNGTTGITNDGGYTGDGVVFADTTPANTLVTTTGGNVGLGTASPGAALDVVGASRAYSRVANGGPSNTAGNNTWWYIGTIRLGDSESATLRMDGTQSYGSGAGIAGCTYLHLRGDNANGLSGYFYGTSSGEFTITSIAYKATATSEQFDLWVRIAEFGSAVVYCDTIGIYVPAATGTGSSTQPSGSTLFTSFWPVTTGGVERARIDSSGNLLVGITTNPNSAKLLVLGGSTGGTSLQAGFGGINATSFQIYHADAGGQSTAATVANMAKVASTNRSINAAGTINASGADYAEYMTKAGDFTVAKGDVIGINAEGKLTNVFADAVSFAVKSTDPSYVGADNWGADLEGDELEAARQLVDRIAFAGQVPVNVTGATAGQYVIPVNDNGAIKGEAVSSPTFEQYQTAVGKVIAVEADGRARIIVKVA
jgi:hypothetical protein